MRETGTISRVSDRYVPRIVDGLLDELLGAFPAVSLVGPRAAGKTTTAVRRGGTVLRLDRPEIRQSVAASPDAMLFGLRPPVILDEWQEVPELLGAVKRSVDEDPSPGLMSWEAAAAFPDDELGGQSLDMALLGR